MITVNLDELKSTEVPIREDGTKDYASMPHMSLDAVPEGATAEGWAKYLTTLAAIPEVLAPDALFPLLHDLVMAHGYDPADAVEAVKDMARRARERYPDSKLSPELQEAADKAVAEIEAEEAKAQAEATTVTE
jgi:hypothetical protein